MIEDKINFVLSLDNENNPICIHQVKSPHTAKDVQWIRCDRTFSTWTEVIIYCDICGWKLEELPHDQQFFIDMHQPFVKAWEVMA